MTYLLILLLLILSELAYFRLAERYKIIDKPNERSSHTRITLRGGGIIFLVAALMAYFSGQLPGLFAGALLVAGIVSFIDDVRPLTALPRLAGHLMAAWLIFLELGLFGYSWILIAISAVLFIGWINAFNFMDGINGIAVLYALVSIGSFYMLEVLQAYREVLGILLLACLVFAFYNVRKRARTFAGDVGSVSLAIFLAFFMIKLIFDTGQLAYILFFAVYGLDAGITILYRFWRRENIFQAHRTHLYQYLANELKWPHVTVAVLYAGSQLLLNLLVMFLLQQGMVEVAVFVGILLLLVLVYMVLRQWVIKKVRPNAAL